MDGLTPDQVLAWAPRLLLTRWRRLSARVRRAVWVSVGVSVVFFLSSLPAHAAGSTAPAALSWIDIRDSHGVSIWQYEMSLDRGGLRNPVRAVWAIFVELAWQVYRGFIAVACWLVDWTLSMDWIRWVAAPMMSLGDALHQIVARFGATTALLTITAVAAVLWMARGRWVLGAFELFLSLVIASLAVGVLSNPVQLVAGEDGMLAHSRDLGMSVAAALQNGGDTTATGDQLREQVTGMVAESFLRTPQQMINFGQIIDGTECEQTYNETIKQGPFGDDGDLREAMGECNRELGEVAGNPNAGMFMSMLVLMPAGFVVVIFAVILCGVILLAGLYALYQALKLIVALVLALLPGAARGSLWMTFAELIISCVTIVFSVVFLAAYLLLIQAAFATGGSPMATFFVVDVLLVVGIIVFWKGRKRLTAATERLASAMSKRPGGGATALPARQRTGYADLYYKFRMAAVGARVVGSTGKAAAGAVTGVGKVAGRAARGTGRAAAAPFDRAWGGIRFAAATAGTTGQGAGTAGQGADPGESLRRRLALPQRTSRAGQLVRVAATVGFAAATGGSSAAAAAARTGAWNSARKGTQQAEIGQLRRAALVSRLRPELPPGPSAHRPPGPAGGPTGPAPAALRPASAAASAPPSATGSGQAPRPKVIQGEVVRPALGPAAGDGAVAGSSASDPAAALRARLDRRHPPALGPAPPRDPE